MHPFLVLVHRKASQKPLLLSQLVVGAGDDQGAAVVEEKTNIKFVLVWLFWFVFFIAWSSLYLYVLINYN